MAIDAARAKSLFLAASDLADPAARAAYLDRGCGDDAELRARVEALLRAGDAAPLPEPRRADATGPFAREAPAAGANADHPDKDEQAGTVIAGKYTLVEVIGEGGMGSVWRAKQTEPVKRFVAVKLIKAGMDSKGVLARFEAERQALALMDHPNIAKVLDGGLHAHRPFFVMDLVKGVPITEYCDKCKLTPKERLALFVPVCQAIQHAHLKGIIHRDIKPSNVLIALYDDKPVVKVIDFGVAKATGGALTERTIDTGFGGVVGTPQYMSPEQATFNNLDIDTRSDVYALGVLLYELLTGSPPFARKELEKQGLLEILRVVREEEPPRPSAKLSMADALPTLSANRGTEPRKLTGMLRNELDWIVMKALEKDRARRYETANGFAADVLRYLAGEPVQAHPPSTAYRVKKLMRRNRGRVAAAGLVLFALVAGMAGTAWGLIRAENALRNEAAQRREADDRRDEAVAERKRADEEAAIAKAVNGFLNQDLLMKGNPDVQASDGHAYDKDVTLRAVVDRAAARIDERFADQPLVAAALHKSVGAVYSGLGDHAASLRHAERGWELTRSVRGDDHRETLEAVNGIGAELLNMDAYDRAEPWFKGNYERAKKLFGEKDKDTLLYHNNLATLYEVSGRRNEAVPLRRLHHELTLGLYGDSDVRSLAALLAKAHDLAALRKTDESDDLTRRAFELARDKLAAYDRELIGAAEAWCWVLLRRGQRDEAEALALRSHENCLKQFKAVGPGSTYRSGRFLARTYLSLGKPAAAEPIARELLAAARGAASGNPGDSDVCDSRVLLIGVYFQQEKWDLAEPLLVEQSAHERSDGQKRAARFNLGNAYARQGKQAAAEPLIRERVEFVKKSIGVETAQHAAALTDLTQNQLAQRHWAAAEQLAHECLVVCERIHPDRWMTFEAKSLLGAALLGQEKYADAEPLLLKGYEGMKEREARIPRQGKPRIPDALDRLIDLYNATNQPDEAQRWQAERARYEAKEAPPPGANR
jgi:non-specific serine/threonine protein kinase/serine/threonine-protein kinase